MCKKIINNRQCKAFAQKGRDFCFRHDPLEKVNALIASQKGGENRQLRGVYGDQVKIKTPEDVKKFLGMVINAIWSDGVPVKVGSSVGFLTRCWLDAFEMSNVEKRLNEIEEKVSRLN